MDNFQHNWPLFWGYIFYFPLTLVAHLVSPPHTEDNLYGHLLPWQQEASPWVFYYSLRVNSCRHQALVPECVSCQAPPSPLYHWKVCKFEFWSRDTGCIDKLSGTKPLGLHKSTVRDPIYKGGRLGTIVNLDVMCPDVSDIPKLVFQTWWWIFQDVTKDPKYTSR